MRGARRRDVQGLRAVAVLLVVAYHAGLPLSGGYVGVDVFFVISGFVIAGLILREVASPDGFSFGRFYSRRARRLLPALALMIGVVTVGSLLVQSPAVAQRATGRAGVAAALSFANWDIYRTTGGYFDAAAESNPLLHTWSLSVEEQFYFAFPLLLVAGLAIASRLSRRPAVRTAVTALLLAGVGVVSFVLAVTLMTTTRALPGISLPTTFAFYASPTRAWEFVAGVLLALLLPTGSRLPRRLSAGLGLVGVGMLAVAATRMTAASGVPGASTLLPVAGTVALIAAGTSHAGLVTRALSVRPMVTIGDLSYSIYLWHWPTIVFARLVFGPARTVAMIAALVSLLPAWASFRYLEEPIHRGRRLGNWSGFRLAATCVAAAVVLAAAPYSLVRVLPNSETVDAYLAAAGQPAERTCEYESLADATGGCLIGPAESPRSVYLLGDSHAGHFAAGIVTAAQRLGWKTGVQTANACPFILPGCARATPSVHWLLTQPPGIVVLALQSDGYVQWGEPADQRVQIWAGALREFASPLVQAGHAVLIVNPTPNYGTWDPRECLGVQVYVDATRCGTSIDRAAAEQFRAPAVAAEREAARLPGVEAVDFFDTFCDARRCYTNRGTQWYAADADHLTVAASESLAPVFEELFRRAASW